MPTAIILLNVDSQSDLAMRERITKDDIAGERFSVVVKSGERMSGEVEAVTRRVGRKRGAVAQYRIELRSASATPEFYRGHGLGQSQN